MAYDGQLIESLVQMVERAMGDRETLEHALQFAYASGDMDGTLKTLAAMNNQAKEEKSGAEIRREQGISDFAHDDYVLGGNLRG